ncbi:hypothetical protein Tco_1485669 [Tanacetum coccineum]
MNTTQAQQKALDDALIAPVDRLEFEKCNMRLKTDIKPKENAFQVVLDALALTPFYQAFLITAEVPAIYMKEFWATVTVHKSSIRFTINKKKLSLDVEVFREILQICPKVENKDTKKTNKMLYPRFTKVKIDYFMSRDQSISRRNKMFWHTARDDTMFTSIRCVSRHEKTQVYGVILPQHLTNQAMLESTAYQTYYAYATGEKAPKEKYFSFGRHLDELHVTWAHLEKKRTRLQTNTKTLEDLSSQSLETVSYAILDAVATHQETPPEYELTEEEEEENKEGDDKDKEGEQEQDEEDDLYRDVNINLERSDAEMILMIVSESKVPDKQQQKVTGTNEGAGVRPEVPDVPEYNSESKEESWTFKGDDKDKDGEQEQDEEDDLYKDVNLNQERSDTEITDAQVNKDMEDAHMTLTAAPLVVQQQSSPVSSDLVSKFINPSLDTDSTTTTTIPIMTFLDIPNFASLFQFEQQVSALETEMSEFKQTNQFAEAVSSILGIVDNYLASKMKEAVDVAAQLQTNKLREEAQAKNQEFLNQVDSTMKTIIKEQVQAQVSKIMPKIEKYVTESLGAEVLVRSTNQPQTSYANLYNALVESYNSYKDIISSYGDVVTLKRGRDDQDKDEDPFAGSNRGSKSRRSGKEVESAKEPTHKESKSTSSSKGASRSQPKSSGKSAHADEHDNDESQWNPSSSPTPDREWNKTKTVDNRPPQPWITQMAQAAGTQSSFNEFLATPIDFSAFIMHRLKIDNMTQEVLTGPTYDLIKGTCKSVVELDHLEEIIVRRHDDQLYKFREGDFKRLCRQDIKDMLLLLVEDKLTNLNLEERGVRGFVVGSRKGAAAATMGRVWRAAAAIGCVQVGFISGGCLLAAVKQKKRAFGLAEMHKRCVWLAGNTIRECLVWAVSPKGAFG